MPQPCETRRGQSTSENCTISTAANAQGASYGQLQAMMNAAAQMQGGSAVAGIARTAQNRNHEKRR